MQVIPTHLCGRWYPIFNFSGSVLTNDDGSNSIKDSLTLSMEFDAGTVLLEMVFVYDMIRSLNTGD